MAKQKTLFDSAPEPIGHHGYPMSRLTDPTPSLAAAYRHAVTGRADSHRQLIVDALKKRDGQTGYELASSTGLSQVECVRRLADLRNLGRVKDCESERPCTVKPASKQQRWWLIYGEDE